MENRIPHDTTKIFTEVFESEDAFVEGWEGSGLYDSSLLQTSNVRKLFWLLYSKFGNSAIANWDVNQFQYRVYAIMFQYGPTWEKKFEIQSRIRGLSEEEIMKGSKTIYNQAYNPSQEPSTSGIEEISTINQQNTTNFKKSKIEGYALLIDLLENDVTQWFLDKFKPLFATFVYTRPDLYVSDKEEN